MTLKQCLQYLIDQGYNYIAFTPALLSLGLAMVGSVNTVTAIKCVS
nr:MAG TPA: cobalt chelatase [Caudoviricetes sp.]